MRLRTDSLTDGVGRSWSARRSAERRYLRADAPRLHMSVYERWAGRSCDPVVSTGAMAKCGMCDGQGVKMDGVTPCPACKGKGWQELSVPGDPPKRHAGRPPRKPKADK
jgi:DnaJ-class molecular chaperone